MRKVERRLATPFPVIAVIKHARSKCPPIWPITRGRESGRVVTESKAMAINAAQYLSQSNIKRGKF